MKEQFIPYEQALELKELGFDENCICHYNSFGFLKSKIIGSFEEDYLKKDKRDNSLPAPLWQQAFDWFRINLDLHSSIDGEFYGKILKLPKEKDYATWGRITIICPTYEEAKLECLKKLIELCKNN